MKPSVRPSDSSFLPDSFAALATFLVPYFFVLASGKTLLLLDILPADGKVMLIFESLEQGWPACPLLLLAHGGGWEAIFDCYVTRQIPLFR